MTTDTLFWDNIAERYAARPVADMAAYERKLEVTKARLTSSDVVLDIGCGTGSLALELAPRVAQVHALDFSPEMIRIGKRKAAAQKVTNITFHENTLEGVQEFAPGQFDGVCAYNILHLVDNRTATLDRIFQLLKPGGFFISSNPCLGGSVVPYRPILAVMRWLGKAPPVALMTREGCLEDIRNAGFVDVATPDVGAAKRVAFVVATKPR